MGIGARTAKALTAKGLQAARSLPTTTDKPRWLTTVLNSQRQQTTARKDAKMQSDSNEFKDLLKSIELNGSADKSIAEAKHLINNNLSNVVDSSSGKIRLRPSLIFKFALIHSQPKELKALASLEIRCLYCRRVISYPSWYYRLGYAVNVFHYFLCFNPVEASKPKLSCKRI